ncbi:hypothetical protein [Nonomuraea jabiensis]|uniref:hypothetical protein n=1 Tax=Nonomuraea jabiensis TaxID=882448 RepID=UPI003D705BBF
MGKLHSRLYELHAAADDQHIFRWPDENDSLGILAYTRQRLRALPPASGAQHERTEQIAHRLKLIRHLRHVLDGEELAAIDDARSAQMTWDTIAVLLGVGHKASAKNRRDRLYIAVADPEAMRTPPAGRQLQAERRKAAERAQRAEQRAAAAIARRYKHVQATAEALLDVSGDLALSDDAEDYLKPAAEILSTDSPTSAQQQALAAYIRLAAGEIRKHAAAERIPPARTEAAALALNAAESLEVGD